jgi:hypothetical protein
MRETFKNLLNLKVEKKTWRQHKNVILEKSVVAEDGLLELGEYRVQLEIFYINCSKSSGGTAGCSFGCWLFKAQSFLYI